MQSRNNSDSHMLHLNQRSRGAYRRSDSFPMWQLEKATEEAEKKQKSRKQNAAKKFGPLSFIN